ncbi:CMRF35-like molecule 5 [Balearica regulorum gibbericeps]|uniref:CMRF35-like molecule 5 n=1 Tax=Balearica regulorum gibbericeps TaxID=100784 RepID=UPI003F61D7F3
MRILLVWTLFPGGWAVTGPARVTAKQGGSLAVSCSYKPGYKLYPKYWCRPSFLWFCFTYIAQTNGSEVTVTQGRVSIRDDHATHSFTVTLSNVKPGDAGWYSCGVGSSLWFRLWHTTEVMVSAAVSATTQGSTVSSLATNPLCPTGCGEPPVVSQLGITHLLLFLSVKVPVVLALVCRAAWVRSRRRSCDRENLQLLEVAGSAGAPGSPRTPEPQGQPPAPLPPTLLGLHHP